MVCLFILKSSLSPHFWGQNELVAKLLLGQSAFWLFYLLTQSHPGSLHILLLSFNLYCNVPTTAWGKMTQSQVLSSPSWSTSLHFFFLFSFQNHLFSVFNLNILYFYFLLLRLLSQVVLKVFAATTTKIHFIILYKDNLGIEKVVYLQCFLTSKTRCKSQIFESLVPFNINLSVLFPPSLYFTAVLWENWITSHKSAIFQTQRLKQRS